MGTVGCLFPPEAMTGSLGGWWSIPKNRFAASPTIFFSETIPAGSRSVIRGSMCLKRAKGRA